MRMLFPGVRERRSIDRHLTDFFRNHAPARFQRAIASISRFYHLRSPRVEWFEYLDWGKSGGRTFEDGKVALVHPENWKRGRKYNSERRWISTVYHEMGHYVLWADAERKADAFAYGFVRGVSANGRARRHVIRRPTSMRSRLRRRRRRARSR
jgi:hypothetical protein